MYNTIMNASQNINSPQNALVFSSNVTPEITIDLEALLKPGQPPNTAVQGKSQLALNLIKPEIVITAFNTQRVIAPYGIPEQRAWLYIVVILALAGLCGGGIAYSYCAKSPLYAIACLAVTTLLVAELVYARQQT